MQFGCVNPMPFCHPTMSKHSRKHQKQTSTSDLASSFYHPLRKKRLFSFYVGSLSHGQHSQWGTEARASSEFRVRRHAMELASQEFWPSNAVRLRPQVVAFCGIKNTINFGRGSPGPHWWAYTAPPYLQMVGRGLAATLFKNPLAASFLRSSSFGPSGHTPPCLLTFHYLLPPLLCHYYQQVLFSHRSLWQLLCLTPVIRHSAGKYLLSFLQ